ARAAVRNGGARAACVGPARRPAGRGRGRAGRRPRARGSSSDVQSADTECFSIICRRRLELARVEALLAVARDAEGCCARAAGHDLTQLGADVVEADAVLRRDALGEAAVDELPVARAAERLAVVVRAC